MNRDVPTLRERILPLVVIGWLLAATRLVLDFTVPEWPLTMFIGLYYGMPVVLLWVGATGRWGTIGWRRMAFSLFVACALIWGVWNSVAYTVGQFMEWEHGRFFPGGPEQEARASAVADSIPGKLGAGLLHGLLSSLASTVWCTVFGTLFIWLPAKRRANR